MMKLLTTLETETISGLNWFRINEMKPNPDKCHLIVADVNHTYYTSKSFIYLENELMESEESVKLLGVRIDQNLTFEEHIESFKKRQSKASCTNAYSKVHEYGKIETNYENIY